MIRPARRLLIGLALIVAPLWGWAGADPRHPERPVSAILLAFALAAVDARRGVRRLRQWSVSAPEHLRLYQDGRSSVPITVVHDSPETHAAQVHIPFPPEFGALDDVISVNLAGKSTVEVSCVPARRGVFELFRSTVQIASPWRLWHISGGRAIRASIRVYPNLRNEREANFLVARQSYGQHRFPPIGKGREFEKLRDYLPHDSFEDIHWKATARRGAPIVKVFQIERTQDVYAVIDSSRLSAREHVIDVYVKAALMLALTAEAQHDKFGLVTFSAGVDRFLPAAAGSRHFGVCRDAIFALQPEPVTPDLEEVFSVLRTRIRKRSLIIFLTALDDPAMAEAFARDIHVISRSHIVLVNVPRQQHIRPLFTGTPPENLDSLYSNLGGHLEWARLQELRRTLQHRNVQLAITDPLLLTGQLTRQYLEVKRRQIL